jgi:predicted 2-oxoglutarate/Fe(II)-dependent dioxygenase YbiX
MTETAAVHDAFVLKGHIQAGDAAPWWKQGRHRFIFDEVGGQYIVISFYGTGRDAIGNAALRALQDSRRFIDEGKASFFCVCKDPRDKTELALDEKFPALRFVWDVDGTMHNAYGIGARIWVVLDPMLRVVEAIPFRLDGSDIPQLSKLLEALPPPSRYLSFEAPAPIVILPNVFEPAFCRHLIDCFEKHGGRESGFMQEVAGMAVESFDDGWKRRRDFLVDDEALIELIKARLARRMGTMLQKTFHFTLSRIERHLIACYAAEDGGHFGPHRDDTVKATEHRRFAVSINLNDDFDGGELLFPEFSPRQYKASPGTAVVFSSSVLHRVTKVTRGRRFAFLPFLHDEAAEETRLANLPFLSQQSASR